MPSDHTGVLFLSQFKNVGLAELADTTKGVNSSIKQINGSNLVNSGESSSIN